MQSSLAPPACLALAEARGLAEPVPLELARAKDRLVAQDGLDEVINLLPPSVRPALLKAGQRCPFKEYINDRLRDDRALYYEKSLYPEDPSIATHPSTDDDDVSASPLNTAHYDFDVELEPPKKKLPSIVKHFVPLYLILALNLLPPKAALRSVPPWPPPCTKER